MEIEIKQAELSQEPQLLALHSKVAKIPDGVIRQIEEIHVKFYESLGFINEGRQAHKIFKAQGKLETPLHMAWFNPNYQK